MRTLMLRRMTQIALSGLVLTVAAAALASTTIGFPDHGVVGEDPDGRLTWVTPGSPAWRDGIRPQQRVLELVDASGSGGWWIRTTDGAVVRESFAASHLEILRLSMWWAIPGLALAALTALLAYRSHLAAAPLLPVALAIAAQPLFALGRSEVTVAGGLAVFLGAGVSVGAYTTVGRPAVIALGAGIVLALGWTVSTLAALPWFDALDGLRVPSALGFAGLSLWGVTDRRRLAEFMTERRGIGFVDLAYLAAAIGIVIALSAFASVPAPILIVGGAIGLAVYPLWRRRTLIAFERLLTAPARQEATIRAIESERGRLAREIHDSPLQELTGVIRRLEGLPGTESEATALRGVAAHLRDVATALHPPVLQDLGLPAALDDLAEQVAGTRPDWQVNVSVDDLTGGHRPPEDVELAAFRVMQEATSNSLSHSSGHTMNIQGAVSSDIVELVSVDDGAGIDAESARAARRDGHFGLESMRERAQGVGGGCAIASGPAGVSVTFRWERAG